MSTPSQVLKQSELLKRLVLDRQTVEEVGHVSQLLLDSQAQRVLGFTCKSGWLGNKQKTFAWKQIQAIGADSVIVSHQDNQTSEITESVNPVLGSEVWTDSGNKVGKIQDLIFNVETGEVVNYMFSHNGWQGLMEGTYLLAPIMISSVGDKRVIVLEKAVQNPQKYTEGLNERIGQAAKFIQEDLKQTKQDLESLKQGSQKAVNQIKDGDRSTENTEVNPSEAETKLQSEPPKLNPESGNLSDKI
ncbi:PRC-barrel domain-containing protein [Nodularia spumigena]|uniref:PRC-barrel domain-containing protein n=1 Tax=Nodularia spumigena TaxID=70799 RepID=UPI00232FCA6F|nr:PRC-barrel domain-containing protein [Nodularia spumigena]MDB9316939.1 PRC-barrel domain-containing protein [Nodularia spumigena CS-590/01A]MDB9326022.1 PRC-barrel domain-containing protein [Nodularia spumigena CS-590/02]MDB9337382.1 PRC-barrel domain-containing protein [Nodularia spumigena CS-590/01]